MCIRDSSRTSGPYPTLINLIKGEFVMLIKVTNEDESFILADKMYHELSSKLSLKDIAKAVSEITGINKNKIYKRFLSFSKNS